MKSVARVALDSPLPNLDRLFDYAIPPELQGVVAAGQRVRVTFGRSKKLLDGFVIETLEKSDFDGKLAPIAELVSTVSVLPANLYKLARAVADRQASTLADVLGGAVLTRSVAVEKKFAESAVPAQPNDMPRRDKAKLQAVLAKPYEVRSEHASEPISDWQEKLLNRAQATLNEGQSVIIAVPDFRDQQQLRKLVAKSKLAEHYVDYATDQTGSKRYSSFLRCLSAGAHLVVGSRSAIYAPLQNLGLIAMFDDGDPSLQEQQSPYIHARDTALLRQKIDNSDLLFVSHARSCEVQRLVEMKYVTEVEEHFAAPLVAFDASTSRVPTLAWQIIREASAQGAVLVQVSSKGTARTAYCQQCSTRALCNQCHGPIWIDSNSMPRCRWCNAQNLAYRCPECKGEKIRQGFGGSTRTVAEFGKAFAGIQIIESTGDKPLLETASGKKIVIATPGAEPSIAGGYEAVVILDANQALSKDSLRASEDAVRYWSNAIAKLKRGKRAVIAGAPQRIGQRFALWQQIEFAQDELDNRRELEFPPHVRLGSVEGPIEVIALLTEELSIPGLKVLGPIQVRGLQGEQNMRFVLKYPYSIGSQVSEAIRAAQLKFSAGLTKTSASGRVSRAVRVRMDDPEVI